MRTLNTLASLAALASIPCAAVAWFGLIPWLMGVALGLATVAAGLGIWVARLEEQC